MSKQLSEKLNSAVIKIRKYFQAFAFNRTYTRTLSKTQTIFICSTTLNSRRTLGSILKIIEEKKTNKRGVNGHASAQESENSFVSAVSFIYDSVPYFN